MDNYIAIVETDKGEMIAEPWNLKDPNESEEQYLGAIRFHYSEDGEGSNRDRTNGGAIVALWIWRPIETAPKDHRNILGRDGKDVLTLVWIEERGWGQESESGRWTSFEPTHWMPLPPCPENLP